MAETIKVLAQSNPAATTLTDAYTVPALTNAVISSIVVANRDSVAHSFRISVAVAGAANDNKQYLYFDVAIGGNDSFAATLGITLDAADVIRVFADAQQLSFNIFGTEIA